MKQKTTIKRGLVTRKRDKKHKRLKGIVLISKKDGIVKRTTTYKQYLMTKMKNSFLGYVKRNNRPKKFKKMIRLTNLIKSKKNVISKIKTKNAKRIIGGSKNKRGESKGL